MDRQSAPALLAGSCTGLKVDRVDDSGTTRPFVSNVTIDLSAESGGGPAGRFYSSPSCSGGAIPSTTAANSATESAVFYYKATQPGWNFLMTKLRVTFTARRTV